MATRLLLAARELAGAMVASLAEADPLEQLVGALVRRLRRAIPASRIGAMTLPWAVRLGIRLKAWNTTPTVSRRCAVRSLPVRRQVSRPSSCDRPGRRRQKACDARQQGGLAAPRGAEEHDELAVVGVEGEAVERTDDVAARAELDGEVADLERAHGPPRTQLDGSTDDGSSEGDQAREQTHEDRDEREGHVGAGGQDDGQGEHRLACSLETDKAKSAASKRDDDGLRGDAEEEQPRRRARATSGRRSRAAARARHVHQGGDDDRGDDPHQGAGVVDGRRWRPPSRGRVSASTSSERQDREVTGGRPSGVPCVTTVVMSGAPWKATSSDILDRRRRRSGCLRGASGPRPARRR